MADWDSLKVAYRESSQRLDNALKELSKVQAELARRKRSNNGASDESQLYQQASELNVSYQSALAECNEQLGRMSRLIPRSDTTRQAHVERFRTQLLQQTRDWDRMHSSIGKERSKLELFGNNSSTMPDVDRTAGTMLQERTALVQTMGVIDGTIESAFASHEMLQAQKSKVSSFGEKLAVMTATVPGINTLVSRINSRQCQETIVLGLVIGACISVWLWLRVLR